MEIKLLTSEQLIRTAKGFIKYGDYGYYDNTNLLGGALVHCGACMATELNHIKSMPFSGKIITQRNIAVTLNFKN